MAGNYFQAIKQKDDAIIPALEYFNNEYEEGRKEINTHGKSLVECCASISAFYDKRLEQYNELCAILKHFEIKLNVLKTSKYKHYLESYQRQLSSTDIKMYVEGNEDVAALQRIINEITLIRNKFESLTTCFETMNYQLNNLSRIYASGITNVIL